MVPQGFGAYETQKKKVLLKQLGADGESVCSSGLGVLEGEKPGGSSIPVTAFEILHHVREGNTGLISTVEFCCI